MPDEIHGIDGAEAFMWILATGCTFQCSLQGHFHINDVDTGETVGEQFVHLQLAKRLPSQGPDNDDVFPCSHGQTSHDAGRPGGRMMCMGGQFPHFDGPSFGLMHSGTVVEQTSDVRVVEREASHSPPQPGRLE